MPKTMQKGKKYGFDQGIANFIVAIIRETDCPILEACEIAGIARTRYYRWVKEHPDFKTAVDAARAEYSQKHQLKCVGMKSLMKRLTGYTITERQVITKPGKEVDADGNPIPVIVRIVDITREIPPDTKAIIFVLTNYDSEHWKTRGHIEVVKHTQGNKLETLTDDELGELIARLNERFHKSKNQV